MKEKIEETRDEVQGIEMIDLGDAMVETKQPNAVQLVLDSCCTYTWFGLDE
ncbi:hypothetical protein ACFPN2_38110 [Steroidobacter flavus]|uniref:Uncharacterized protein n=1 Tax=Steroidobacter flavus TaxID=1842136 RepID=A0ABV8T730_9GAMM